jgi:hypothetical protein
MNMETIKVYLKAILAFVTPGVIALVAAVQDASPGGTAITVQEWVAIGAACIIPGGVVAAVPNKPAYSSTGAYDDAELADAEG